MPGKKPMIQPAPWFLGSGHAKDRKQIDECMDIITRQLTPLLLEKFGGAIPAFDLTDIEYGCLVPSLCNTRGKDDGVPDHVPLKKTCEEVARFIKLAGKIVGKQIKLRRDLEQLRGNLHKLKVCADALWHNEYVGTLAMFAGLDYHHLEKVINAAAATIDADLEDRIPAADHHLNTEALAEELKEPVAAARDVLAHLPTKESSGKKQAHWKPPQPWANLVRMLAAHYFNLTGRNALDDTHWQRPREFVGWQELDPRTTPNKNDVERYTGPFIDLVYRLALALKILRVRFSEENPPQRINPELARLWDRAALGEAIHEYLSK